MIISWYGIPGRKLHTGLKALWDPIYVTAKIPSNISGNGLKQNMVPLKI